MPPKQHDPGRPQAIPVSAVYRQLDDYPAPEAADYDPAAFAARLMTRWASDDPAAGAEEPAPLPVQKAAAQILTIRHDLVLQLARRRFTGTIAAYAAILGVGGIAAAAAFIPHLAAPVLVGIGSAAVLIVSAVIIIHQITMRSISRDHDRALSENVPAAIAGEEPPLTTQHTGIQRVGSAQREERPAPLIADDDWPKSPRPRFRPPWQSAAAAVIGLTAAIHDGTGGIILLAATLGVVFLAFFILITTALFGSQSLSERAFHLLRAQFGSRDRPVGHRKAGRNRITLE